jgi:hypothetical protein
MTNAITIRNGLAWRHEGEALVTLTPGECAAEIERLQSLVSDLAIWAGLVIAELRIDTPLGEWDRLDKLEAAFNAARLPVEPRENQSCGE